ncbi:MAG: Na/Pi cotransporter family protein [Candidatus Spechtbacterales bacterium]|nr:Na/Pi cotransporter family protein [Candidatus Spechtbacterales bacterium]
MKEFLTKRILFAATFVALFIFFAYQLPGHDGNGNFVDWPDVFQWLFVGLVIFLYGMGEMEYSMKAVAGNKMRSALKTLTNHPIKGAGAGLVTTAVIQSSSVTTVMLISFVSAGLLSFARTIPPIIGANIGTTVTAQIVSFNIGILIPILLLTGFGAMKLFKSRQKQRAGRIFLGLGFLLWGMDIMKNAMEPLRDFQPFIDLMLHMDNVVLAILIAAVFTALVQSSSATIGIIIVFASQGLISLEAGIALILGANLGTTITAVLASIGKSRGAIRVAAAHVLIKFFGILLFIGFIPQFAHAVELVTQTTNTWFNFHSVSSGLAREVANAHTLFSFTLAILLLPFSRQIAQVIERIIPEKEKEQPLTETKYLIAEDNIEDAPLAAIDGARLEINRMGEKIDKMFKEVLPAIFEGDRTSLKNIAEEDDAVDKLYRKIVKYLSKIRAQELSDELSEELDDVTAIARYLEQIGDIIENNIVPAGLKLAERNIFISDKTQELLTKLHSDVHDSLHLLLEANKLLATHEDKKLSLQRSRDVAIQIKKKRDNIEDASDAVFERTGSRLTKAYAAEADITEALTRAYYLARNAAKVIADK